MTTSIPKRKPIEYTLHLQFDVAQATKSLQYKFTAPDGSSPYKTMGGLAGTANFQQGDTVRVSVTATGLDTKNVPVTDNPKQPKMHFAYPPDFSVINCSLVSTGTLGHEETPDLSLFDEHNAITAIQDWGFLEQETENVPSDDDVAGVTLAAKINSLDTLLVTAKNGQWAISGYLSVLVKTDTGEGWPRLFYFDPEGSSGTGTGGGMGGG